MTATFALGGDLVVHRLGYGAMRITGEGVWGDPPDRGEAIRVLRRAVELGVDLIDTADSYGPHVSEELIAEALHPYPDGLVIATKAGFVRTGPGRWVPLGRPEYLRQECLMSMRRLRVERIDLFQLHRIDPRVPADEQIGELHALQREGLVRHIGLSEVSVADIEHARRIAPIASVQNRYNLADREHEGVLDHCEREGVAFIPWFPLATGRLAREGGPLAEMAREAGATPGQLALAWLLRRSQVMLPIPGTASVAHLEENTAAARVQLTDEQVDQLSRLV
ncbi:MAG TPA: aldo/keto reductase [Candidatus Dormibacteraeota bacterium]|nr:aldo/keto reductase [Candidatus Dormibacteraeota bacterium]